jgi:uncharacterized OsmC-like protein
MSHTIHVVLNGKPETLTVEDFHTLLSHRGGTASGPTPLEYFLTGALTCLMNQVHQAEPCPAPGIGEYQRNRAGDIRYAVEGTLANITYDVYLQGTESPDAVREVTLDAEWYCYVHNTLKAAILPTVHVHLNGQHLLERSSTPAATVP